MWHLISLELARRDVVLMVTLLLVLQYYWLLQFHIIEEGTPTAEAVYQKFTVYSIKFRHGQMVQVTHIVKFKVLICVCSSRIAVPKSRGRPKCTLEVGFPPEIGQVV